MVVMNVPFFYGCDECGALFMVVMNGSRPHACDESVSFLWL